MKTLRDVKKTKLAYALLQNASRISKIMQPVEVVQAQIDKLNNTELTEYDTKRIDLCHEHAKIGEDGKPVIINVDGVEKFEMANKEEFDKAFAELRKEYKESFERQRELQKQLVEVLNEEVEIILEKISIDCLPPDMNLEEMEKIKDLLDL